MDPVLRVMEMSAAGVFLCFTDQLGDLIAINVSQMTKFARTATSVPTRDGERSLAVAHTLRLEAGLVLPSLVTLVVKDHEDIMHRFEIVETRKPLNPAMTRQLTYRQPHLDLCGGCRNLTRLGNHTTCGSGRIIQRFVNLFYDHSTLTLVLPSRKCLTFAIDQVFPWDRLALLLGEDAPDRRPAPSGKRRAAPPPLLGEPSAKKAGEGTVRPQAAVPPQPFRHDLRQPTLEAGQGRPLSEGGAAGTLLPLSEGGAAGGTENFHQPPPGTLLPLSEGGAAGGTENFHQRPPGPLLPLSEGGAAGETENFYKPPLTEDKEAGTRRPLAESGGERQCGRFWRTLPRGQQELGKELGMSASTRPLLDTAPLTRYQTLPDLSQEDLDSYLAGYAEEKENLPPAVSDFILGCSVDKSGEPGASVESAGSSVDPEAAGPSGTSHPPVAETLKNASEPFADTELADAVRGLDFTDL